MSEAERPLLVVPTESHALFFARQGARAETRRALFRRLADALLGGGSGAPQIASRTEADLAAAHAHGGPRVGRAAERALDLLVDAHGDVPSAMRALAKTRLRSFAKGAEDTAKLLGSRGLVHPRETPARLAKAIAEAPPARIAELVGAREVHARLMFDWSASDGAFFRALDLALSRVGGFAVVHLPEIDARFDAAREESPHERVAAACARELDAAPRFEPAEVPATWALTAPAELAQKVTLVRAADRSAEASACAALVRSALDAGLALDDVGIALPLRGGPLELALARALEEHGLSQSAGEPELSVAPLIRRFERELRKELPERATRGDYLAHVTAALAASEEAQRSGVGAFGVLATDEAPTSIGRAELVALARGAAAWDALALTDYAAATKRLGLWDAELSSDAFLLEAMGSLPAPREPSSRRVAAVRLGTLKDFVGLPLGLLVVVAANDRGEPGDAAATADPLVRRIMDERRAAHAVSVAACLGSARSLVLSFDSRDEDGGELAPAPYVAWLARGGAKELSVGASPLAPDRASPRDRRLRALAMEPRERERLAPDALARAQVELSRERFFLDATRAATDLTGRLDARDEVTSLLTTETGSERALSVTAVERMAACAFVGFAESVLGARERAPDERLPSVRDEGTLVHAALARAFTACKAELARPPASRDAVAIRALGARAADEGIPEGTPEILRARVHATVAALLDLATEDVRNTFYAAEQGFGDGAAWPAHVIASGAERLVLRGQIDRVDVGTDGRSARVLDYKRRLTTIKRAPRTLGVTSLQVPLYACVAARALGKEQGESGFLPTDPRDLGLAGVPVRGLAESMARVLADTDGVAEIERRALEIVKGLRAGDLRPLPVEPGHCAHCPHDGACRKPRFSIEHERED